MAAAGSVAPFRISHSVLNIALLGFGVVRALEVTTSSECSSLCMDEPQDDPSDTTSSNTYPSDLVCNDWELLVVNSTVLGQKFNECLTCEGSSTAYNVTSGENDVFWFLCRTYHEDSNVIRLINDLNSQYEIYRRLVRLCLARAQSNVCTHALQRDMRWSLRGGGACFDKYVTWE